MSDDVLNGIQKAFKNAFGTEASLIQSTTTPDQVPGWDSLGHAVLTSELESQFSITFNIEELMAMEDVDKIINIINFKLAKV